MTQQSVLDTPTPASAAIANGADPDPAAAKDGAKQARKSPPRAADPTAPAAAAEPAAAEPAAPPRAGLPPSALLGTATWLLTQSRAHRHLFLTDLDWMVAPPLALTQFRLFQHDGRAVGFATWAYLSEDAEQRYLNGGHRLRPADWKSGDRLWLIDVVAPFGGVETIFRQLRDRVFKDRDCRVPKFAKDGKGAGVGYLREMRLERNKG